MVYWVIAKVLASAPVVGHKPVIVERLGPFESRGLAAKARDEAADRYRNHAGARLEIVCDFS
ncbi:MAG: hypothetical protein WAS21_27610 [Geminicoccaceae bacterium]